MPFYQKVSKIGSKFIAMHTLLKYGFNLSPMYRRSTARITYVSPKLLKIQVIIKISYKNRNIMGSIFGGSLFSAIDPIPMTQLFYIIGNDYVVWDKSSEIFFKRPVKQNVYADFTFTKQEIDDIKKRVTNENEITIVKNIPITSKDGNTIFCEVNKTIYVANKKFYKEKLANRKKRTL